MSRIMSIYFMPMGVDNKFFTASGNSVTQFCRMTLTLSVPNFRRYLSSTFFFFFKKTKQNKTKNKTKKLSLGKKFICKVERAYAVCKSLLISPVAVKKLNLKESNVNSNVCKSYETVYKLDFAIQNWCCTQRILT